MSEAAQAAGQTQTAAEAALAKVVSEFERHFVAIDVYKSMRPKPAYAPTGELYVEHRHGPCDTIEAVVASWEATAKNIRLNSPEGATLYWRVRPEIAHVRSFGHKAWWIYSRFIVSDKPAKES